MRVRGAMFDLGGTLCGYNLEMGGATAAGLARLGFELADPEVMTAAVTAMAEASESFAARPSYLHRELFRDQFARTIGLLGGEVDGSMLDWFEAENLATIIEHVRPRPDACDVLRALRDRGLYCAVVSNADDDFLGPNLVRHGLDALLDDWTSSEEAGSCKPDPTIYRHALSKAGLDAEEVLFVGDSVQHDIAGAAAIGMRSALISNGLDSAPFAHGLDAAAVPDYRIDQLTELLDIVDRLVDG